MRDAHPVASALAEPLARWGRHRIPGSAPAWCPKRGGRGAPAEVCGANLVSRARIWPPPFEGSEETLSLLRLVPGTQHGVCGTCK
jgi:hypothetical protein